MSSPNSLQHAIPIKDRNTKTKYFHALTFFLYFNAAILLISLLQIIISPLYLFVKTRSFYYKLIHATKASFAQSTVAISQFWAPTQFIVTTGRGIDNATDWITYDHQQRKLTLPDRAIWVSNHQLLADWIYIWSFAYFADLHASILITLKSSIKWIPFVGWACQFYSFIFLSRSWIKDKSPFLEQLQKVSRKMKAAKLEGDGASASAKLALLVFPEGTLVTGNTRPISAKYAEKCGVSDYHHLLHPRSTGLFFALRALSPDVPDLALLDLTIAYPSILPPPIWPEDHYSLSIWSSAVPPPQIHIHLRSWDVRKEIPLGDSSVAGSEGTDEEKKAFEDWLRGVWREKDELMKKFNRDGSFSRDGVEGTDASGNAGKEKEGAGGGIRIPLELRSNWEILPSLSFFLPVIFGWIVVRILR